MAETIIYERFWSRVKIAPSGCWEWTAAKSGPMGYGCCWDGLRRRMAHRFLYETLYGDVPQGFELDHLCRNPKCVNPNHLEVVTRSQNVLRGIAPQRAKEYYKRQQYCKRGHKFTETNTYRSPNGRRRCRTCAYNYLKEWRKARAK